MKISFISSSMASIIFVSENALPISLIRSLSDILSDINFLLIINDNESERLLKFKTLLLKNCFIVLSSERDSNSSLIFFHKSSL